MQTRWEFQGLANVIDPSHFTFIVKGTLYPDRRGNKSRLRGLLEMNIIFVLPPALGLVPENVRDSLGKGVRTFKTPYIRYCFLDITIAQYNIVYDPTNYFQNCTIERL